jgi:hypothetical protein
LGLTLFGILCIGFLPAYLGTTSDSGSFVWSLTGGVFGGGLADILHVIQSNGDGSWTVAVRAVVVLVLLLTVVGAGTGVARIAAASKRREDRNPRRRGVAVLSVRTGLVGLVTAVLNFMGAGGSTPLSEQGLPKLCRVPGCWAREP